ncbi:MAG: hypothetical protein KDG89_03675 [Geminicoccaceae bacterium]|nr:hypothetical protein [Geminicoccaceae bacterium]
MRDEADLQTRRRGRFDVTLFFLALFLGAGLAIALKVMHVPQAFVTAGPAAVLLAYAGLIAFTKRFRLPEDRAGESVYYLGFLYTLVSLACALYEFAQATGEVEPLIADFGIALTTTILGLALRVAFAQGRRDPIEFEHEARIELSDAVRRFRASLDNGAGELERFRRAMQQSFQDSAAEHARHMRESVDAPLQGLKAALETFEGHAGRLGANAGRLVDGIGGLGARIETIDLPVAAIEAKLAPLADAIGGLTASLERRAAEEVGHADGLKTLAARTEALLERMRQGFDQLDRGARSIGEFEKSAEQAHRACGALGQALRDGTAAERERVRSLVEAGKAHADALRAALDADAEGRLRHQGDLERAVRETVGVLRDHNAGLGRELEGGRAIAGRVAAEFADLVGRITQTVEANGALPGRQGAAS